MGWRVRMLRRVWGEEWRRRISITTGVEDGEVVLGVVKWLTRFSRVDPRFWIRMNCWGLEVVVVGVQPI